MVNDNYTDEQRKAIDISKHISVQANAGSGKTRILVDRYYNLLVEQNIEPQNILAITFTKKAAAEMKARVIKRIEGELSKAIREKKIIIASNLRKKREKLIKAKISTINSFCTGILRDYPIECNVLPNFTKLDEIEIMEIKEDAVDDAISSYVESNEKNKSEYYILDQLDINELSDTLKELLSKPDTLLNLSAIYKNDNYLSDIRNLYRSKVRNFFDSYLYDIKSSMEALNNIQDLKQKPKDLINEALIDLNDLLDNNSSNDDYFCILGEFINKINQNRIITADGYISGSTFRSNRTDYSQAKSYLEKYADDFKSNRNLLEPLCNNYDENHFGYIIEYVSLVLDTYKILNDYKDSINGISFDDMIIRAKKALEYDNVREQIAGKFKYIMVDEFQDTNTIQYELIKSLIVEFSNLKAPKNNLYIVGDAKQSIYRFRNADVKVFLEAQEDIINLNINNGEPDPRPGEVKMTYTFRLFPVIADFINQVCGKIFKSDNEDNEYDLKYEYLQFGKTDEVFPNELSQLKSEYLSQKFGQIDYLFSYKNDDESTQNELSNITEKDHIIEADKIARYINEIVYNPNHTIYDDKTEEFREITYGDIVILSRQKKGFSSLQSAFMKSCYNIPFVINSGSGFYNTQEIMDFTAFIKFLYDNSDDVSLAAILKADFFRINDTELFSIARTESRNQFFWSKFNIYCTSDTASFEAKRAHSILHSIIPAARRIPISGLIDLITEETGWFGIISKTEGNEQKIANINKLRAFAFAFENRGFNGLYDFANQLERLAESSNEGEATYFRGKNSVNIMTIHMSKGLEFPVVILFRTNARGANNTGVLVSDKDHGISFKHKLKSDIGIWEKKDTLIHDFIKEKNSDADIAEEKRILYVAMTRAKYRLCISAFLSFNKGEPKPLSKPYGIFSLIAKSNSIFDNFTEDSLKDFSIEYNMDINCLNQSIDFSEKKYCVKAFEPADDIREPVHNNEIKKQSKEPLLLIEDIKRSHSKEMFSPTKIQIWVDEKKAPSELSFTKKYQLGLADDNKIYISDDTIVSGDEELFGTSAGTIIHNVMENMKSWLDSSGTINKNDLNKTINYYIDISRIKNPKSVFYRILNDIEAVMNSKFIKSALNNILKSKFEYRLSLSIDDDYITGLIDLLYIEDEGNYEIWDWKSNYTGKETDRKRKYEELKNRYEFQMKTYCYIISFLKPEQECYKAKLLFTVDAAERSEDDGWIVKYQWNKLEISQFGEEIKNLITEIKKNSLYSRFTKQV